jgi:hypothetical protein
LNKLLFVWAGSLLACLGACGDAGSAVHEANSQEPDSAKSASIVRAGEESAKLGVDRWAIESGTVRGLNRSNEVVAEFYADGETHTIHSVLPAVGVKDITNPENSTLTDSTSAYFHALAGDLGSAAAKIRELPKIADAQSIDKQSSAWYQSCHSFYSDCDVAGFQGVLWGAWRYYECRMPTPACGNAIALIVAR